MEELDYKPNSNKYKEEQKALQNQPKRVEKPVVSGKTRTKTNEVRKFTRDFFAEDWESIKAFVKNDIIIPALKRTFYDVIEGSLSRSLFGGQGASRNRSSADKVSYRDYTASSRRDDRRSDSYRSGSRSVLDYDDIIFDNRGDAEAVLTRMIEILDEYETVSVADLYELARINNPPHTANKYGWDNLSKSYVDRNRDGYVIRLPRVISIR